MELERMDDFFSKRIDGYENHMMCNVQGCKEGYVEIVKYIPKDCKTLLDLGCGTGLELKEIFKKYPNLGVTAIDLTRSMLEKLKENYRYRNVKTICGSYFDADFGSIKYDCAISFQTMHHFNHKDKVRLYKRIHDSLSPCGVYIECDYMIEDQKEEDYYFSEANRLRKEQNISDDEFVHYDTPCTVENQINMFRESGFKDSKKVWKVGSTVIIVNKF